MKFVSISMIKDEADIIELFVRINSRVIDHFFIVDNGSSDKTLKILQKLAAEGFPMTVFIDKSGYNQELITSKTLRSAAAQMKFDWAFVIDGDEFINIPRAELERELSTIQRNHVASLKWSTWIPLGDLYYKYKNPLFMNFQRKLKETENYEKVIVPHDIASHTVLEVGNHGAYINHVGTYNTFDGSKIEQHLLKCGVLDHVPVRSSGQILVKALTGAISLSLKSNRGKHEGYHWDNATHLIRTYKYEVDDLLLRHLALAYLAKRDVSIPDQIEEGSKLGLETDIIKYDHLHVTNEKLLMYNYMQQLATRIRESK